MNDVINVQQCPTLGGARLMQAWLPVILVWFISLFTSTFTVITYIYRYLNHGHYRWKNIHKYLSPWILLALLTAAFMVGNIWLIASSREFDVDRMKGNAWIFIVTFVGSFIVVCILIVVLWSKYKKRASKNRIVGQTKQSESIRTADNYLQKNVELIVEGTPFENNQQVLDKTTNHELNSNYQQNVCQVNDDILVLRNLSNPDEEFCINLSNSTAPVVKRKPVILDLTQDFAPKETILPKSKMVYLEDGNALDIEL